MVDKRSALTPATLASFVGVVLFAAVALFTDKREPWDSLTYWSVAYPVALLACAFLGYLYPERPWRWALFMFEAQFVAMCVRNGELGNLWPFGLVLFAILALPGAIAAAIASRFTGKR